MANSTETSISNLKIHKVPNYETWAELYGQSNGIGTNELVIIPPNEIQPTIKGKGILKGDGEGNISAAEPNVDFIPPIAGEAKEKIIHFEDGVDDLPLSSLILDINPIQAGTGDPSPTNVRAISGRTGVEITRAGKNLCPPAVIGRTFNNNTGADTTDTGSASTDKFAADFSSGYMTISWATAVRQMQFAWDASGNFIGRTAGEAPATGGGTRIIQPTDFSSGSGTKEYSKIAFIAIRFYFTSSDTGDVSSAIQAAVPLLYPQVEAGNTASTYEPYTGSTYPIALGRTVYGGKLNVTTGKLTVTHEYATFNGTESWGGPDEYGNFYLSLSNANKMTDRKTGGLYNELLFNILKHGGTDVGAGFISSGGYLDCKPTGISTVADWKTFLGTTNLQVVYPLATPITYQLTPQEITTLLGENNIWADCGDIEIKYGENPNTRNEIQSIIENTNHFVKIENNSSIVHFEKGINNFPLSSFICNINPVQAGTGDPSPSNVRTISGFDTVDICHASRNLLVDNRTYPHTSGSIQITRDTDGGYIINGSKSSNAAVVIFNFAYPDGNSTATQCDNKKWLPNGQYKMSIVGSGLPSGANASLQVFYNTKTDDMTTAAQLGSVSTNSSEPTTITISDAHPFVWFRLLLSSGAYTFDNAKLYPMIIRTDETDTSWDAPRSSKPISLGRTVYGGKLNVTTGELTVTHTILEMDGSTTGYKFTGKSSTLGINEYYISALADAYKYNTTTGYITLANLQAGGFYCSVAPVMGGDNTTNAYGTTVAMNSAGNFQPRIRFLTSDTIQDTTAANAWLASLYANGTPCVFCYKLATAQTYQLTPVEVATLLGENNIWTDCGDIISLKCLQNSNFYQEMQTVVDTLIPSQSGNSGKYLKTNGSTLSWDSPVSKIYTASCSTAASTTEKVATLDDSTGFSLATGVMVVVRFTNGNTATTPTLNVNSSGAKTIAIPSSATAYTTGNGTTYNTWGAYESILFTYTGTYWTHIPSGRLGYITYNLAISNSNSIDDILDDIYMTNGIIKSAGDGETISAAAAGTDYVAPSSLGAASGVATLDGDGKITPDQLTSKIESVTASRNLATSDNCHTLLCSNSNVTLTIPNTITTPHFECEIIRWQSANTVTIAAGNNVKIAFSGGTTAYTSFKITDACESAILKRIMESSGNQYWLIQGKVEAIS